MLAPTPRAKEPICARESAVTSMPPVAEMTSEPVMAAAIVLVMMLSDTAALPAARPEAETLTATERMLAVRSALEPSDVSPMDALILSRSEEER